jgi:hypothetical protein
MRLPSAPKFRGDIEGIGEDYADASARREPALARGERLVVESVAGLEKPAADQEVGDRAAPPSTE